MNQDFQFRMPGRIPLPQCFAHAQWCPGHDKTTLRGNKMAGHGRAVRDLGLALGQLGDIDVVENGEAGQLHGGIGGGRG